jgi:hypothetical protein
MFDVKPYDEPIDSLTLLYPLADPSFYRIRCFGYFMAEQWKFKDVLNDQLYGSATLNEFKTLVRSAVKRKDIVQEEDTLYYFLGGTDVQTEEGSKHTMSDIICNAENENKKVLIELGYDVSLPDVQNRDVDDSECAPYLK